MEGSTIVSIELMERAWVEVYYAVLDKALRVKDDYVWAAQLKTIADAIGRKVRV